MGASASVYDRPLAESVTSDYEEDLTSNAYQNLLRLTIIENIRLEFQRPTTVLVYGCPYGCLDSVTNFLAHKLDYGVVACEVGQSLTSDSDSSKKAGTLYQNYPQTFEQMLAFQTLTNSCQIVVIFLNCSYAVSFTRPSFVTRLRVSSRPRKWNGFIQRVAGSITAPNVRQKVWKKHLRVRKVCSMISPMSHSSRSHFIFLFYLN
jgi:hypothetical protein